MRGTELLRPIHQLSLERRLEILELMPGFTPEGLEGEEVKKAAVPTVEEDWLLESPITSGAYPAVAPGGAGPSSGDASSSKPATPEEILEISSDRDEDFVVAPSRRAMEDEEDSGPEAVAKKCEPRSKAIHDRAARSLENTPQKRKAEAAPEEPVAGAALSGLRRATNKVWIDSRAKSSG